MLNTHEIHIWVADLSRQFNQIKQRVKALTPDELERANRFRAAIHQNRFIASRYLLRTVLGKYLDLPPQEIRLAYTKFNKPYLTDPNTSLRFNLAHSEDQAILGITSHYNIGVDIEKIRIKYPQKIAERFFHKKEYDGLNQLPEKDQASGFFRVWSRKEAIIKATGKGLSMPLSSFYVSLDKDSEIITIDNQSWSLTSLEIHPGYQAAVASNQKIEKIKISQFK